MDVRVVSFVGVAMLAAVIEAASSRYPFMPYAASNGQFGFGRQTPPRGRPQFQGGGQGFGGGSEPDIPLVAKYDANHDGWLNPAERQAARAFADSQGLSVGRGRGGSRNRLTVPVTGGPAVDPRSVPRVPASVPLYDPSTLRTLFLTFENADWERELMAFKRTDVRVPATLVVDGQTYRDVGVQFHGNSSFSSVPQGLKHSMTLAMDFIHDAQRLDGYRTLTLLNSHEDPTLLRAVLYLQIAREYLPAPKANFVHVVINGESWGIYPNVQHFNKDFIREWFNDDDGARWKVPGSPNARSGLEYIGEDTSAYRRHYELKTKESPEPWAALIALTRTLDRTPVDRLARTLAPTLDIDGALRFLALDNALVNNDGYWTRASDYSIHLDSAGRFHLIPYDVNETFPTRRGMGGRGGTAELDPLVGLGDPAKPLRSKLLADAALRARYVTYVREIAAKWLDWERIGPVVDAYHALIRPVVERDVRKLDSFEGFEQGPDELRGFADRRRDLLLSEWDR